MPIHRWESHSDQWRPSQPESFLLFEMDDNEGNRVRRSLQPQIQSIFNELEGNLPTIDFDQADVSMCDQSVWLLQI